MFYLTPNAIFTNHVDEPFVWHYAFMRFLYNISPYQISCLESVRPCHHFISKCTLFFLCLVFFNQIYKVLSADEVRKYS